MPYDLNSSEGIKSVIHVPLENMDMLPIGQNLNFMTDKNSEYHPWGAEASTQDFEKLASEMADVQANIFKDFQDGIESKRLELLKERCAERNFPVDFDQPAWVWTRNFHAVKEGKETAVFYKGHHVITFIDQEPEINGDTVKMSFKYF